MKPVLDEKRLAERRKLLGINKLEASRRMHLTQSGYVRYESGERKPTYDIIMAMALVLGTSVDYLTNETDDPSPDLFLLSKAEDKELFALVERARSLPEDERARLLAYCEAFR